MAARVVRISIAPVKSLALVHPDEVTLERGGVAGNRRFWLRDETGRLFNGKRDGALQQIRPEWDESTRRLALLFPDGKRVDGVVELGAEVVTEMYGYLMGNDLSLQAATSRVTWWPRRSSWATRRRVARSGSRRVK